MKVLLILRGKVCQAAIPILSMDARSLLANIERYVLCIFEYFTFVIFLPHIGGRGTSDRSQTLSLEFPQLLLLSPQYWPQTFAKIFMRKNTCTFPPKSYRLSKLFLFPWQISTKLQCWWMVGDR